MRNRFDGYEVSELRRGDFFNEEAFLNNEVSVTHSKRATVTTEI